MRRGGSGDKFPGVIPAKAGIQLAPRGAKATRAFADAMVVAFSLRFAHWIPAFAGMTQVGGAKKLDSGFGRGFRPGDASGISF